MVMYDHLPADPPGGVAHMFLRSGGLKYLQQPWKVANVKAEDKTRPISEVRGRLLTRKGRRREAVSVETNGRSPLVYVWALKDWVGNWGWNVFTLMDEITSCFHFWMCQSHHPGLVSAALVPFIRLKISINVRSDQRSALLRFCMTEMRLMISAVLTLGYPDGTLTRHFTLRPSTEMKRCGFPACSITPLFCSCSPTCLCLLEQRKPLPATCTIKRRLMKLYRRPGQIAGCRGWRS